MMQAIPSILLPSMPRVPDLPGEGEACPDVSFGDEFDANPEGAEDAPLTATDKVMGGEVVPAGMRIPDFWLVRPEPDWTASDPASPALEAHLSAPAVGPAEGAALAPDMVQLGPDPPGGGQGQSPNAVTMVPIGATDLAVNDLSAAPAPAPADDDGSQRWRHPAADTPVAAMTLPPAAPVAVVQAGAMLPEPVQGLVPLAAADTPVAAQAWSRAAPVAVVQAGAMLSEPAQGPLPLAAAAILHAATAPTGEHGRPAVAPVSPGNDTDGSLPVPVATIAPRVPQAAGPRRAETEGMAIEAPAAEDGTAPRLGSTAQPEGQVRLGPPVSPGEARFACVVTTVMQSADLTPLNAGPSPDELLDASGSVMSLHGSQQWPTLQPPAHLLQAALPSSPVAALAAQIVQSASLGESTTEIALSPDELGEVRLSFRPHETDASRIVVMMTFERPEAMDLFRRNADQLVADLKTAGFTGADLGFAHSSSGNGGSAGPDHPPSHAMSIATDAPVGPAPAALRPGATTSLDLRL